MKNLAWRHVYSLRALVFCLLHCKLRTGKCFTMGTAVYNEYRFFNAWISIRVYISGLNAWESSLTNTLYYLWVHFLKVSLKDRKWDSEAKRIKRLGARKLWLFSPIWSWLNWHFFWISNLSSSFSPLTRKPFLQENFKILVLSLYSN